MSEYCVEQVPVGNEGLQVPASSVEWDELENLAREHRLHKDYEEAVSDLNELGGLEEREVAEAKYAYQKYGEEVVRQLYGDSYLEDQSAA